MIINKEFTFIKSVENCKYPYINIFIGNQEEFVKNMKPHSDVKNANGFVEWVANNCEIYKASLFVDNALKGYRRKCVIKEELVQSLGCTGETDYPGSVFHHSNKMYVNCHKLIDMDINTLKILYNENTKPCMKVNDIRALYFRDTDNSYQKKLMLVIIIVLLLASKSFK